MLAGTFNTDYNTFEFITDYMNTVYRSLYDYIATSPSNYYNEEQIITKNDADLNENIYMIKSVSFLNELNGTFTEIQRQPENTYVSNTYTIKNNVFHYNGEIGKPIRISYVPYPLTITAPFEKHTATLNSPAEFGAMFDDGIYYKDTDGNEYFYDFGSDTSSPAENYKEATEATDENLIEAANELGTPDKIYEDEDYAVASYPNGDIYIFQDYSPVKYNIDVTKGHSTKGEVYGIRTNDRTGYGIFYYDTRDDKYYYAPFVPDTVMNYPSNALFHLMELRIARQLASMNGLPTDEIARQEAEAESQFYTELRKDRSHLRINNIYKRSM